MLLGVELRWGGLGVVAVWRPGKFPELVVSELRGFPQALTAPMWKVKTGRRATAELEPTNLGRPFSLKRQPGTRPTGKRCWAVSGGSGAPDFPS